MLERFVTRYVYPDATTTIVIDPTGQTQRLRALGPGVAQRSFANGIDEVTQYDLDGKCLAKVSTGHIGRDHAWSKRFEYSGEGDLLARHDSQQGITRHAHDAAHRLASSVHPDGQVDSYKIDLAGNVLEAPGLVAAVTTANTLHSANGSAFEYNARDHVARRYAPEGVLEYRYDSRDQLKAIDAPASAYRAQHDVLGRRTEKDVNGHKTVFYWDTDRLAAELLPDGKLRVYVYPNESALVPLMFVDYASADAAPESGRRYYVHSDHLGCPERIFDDEARTVWSARIDPYGTAHVEVGSEFHQPLRWPGHYFDAETGLHENRFRTYSPELCRYLQSDPLGVAGGVNLHAYTDNPTRAVDLNGLKKSPNCMDGDGDDPKKKRKSEEGPDQEGAARKGPKSKGVSDAQIALAASPGNTRAHIKARKLVAKRFYKQHGLIWDPNLNRGEGGKRRPSAREAHPQLNGIDYSKPLTVGPPPRMPPALEQWQAPGGRQGQFYAEPGTQPQALGIHDRAAIAEGTPPVTKVVPKVAKPYEMNNDDQPYMKSTAAPIKDTWSVPGQSHYAEGGADQYYVPNQSTARPA